MNVGIHSKVRVQNNFIGQRRKKKQSGYVYTVQSIRIALAHFVVAINNRKIQSN